jgi:3-dehydroquinate dehydratase I
MAKLFFPQLVLVIDDKMTSSKLRSFYRQGVRLIEFRLDFCSELVVKNILSKIKLLKSIPFKIIATIRSSREGGKGDLSEEERGSLYEQIIPFVDLVDIELSSKSILSRVLKQAKKFKVKTILSFHDFKKTPSRNKLEKIFFDCKKKHADFIKIAVMARSWKDMHQMLLFTLNHQSDPIITLSMGQKGALSRIYFPSAGSRWTYTYATEATAPGQWNLKEMLPLFEKVYPQIIKRPV